LGGCGTGGILPPVSPLDIYRFGRSIAWSKSSNRIETCPNAWIEFSARDPWRFGGLAGEDDHLLTDWHDLVLE